MITWWNVTTTEWVWHEAFQMAERTYYPAWNEHAPDKQAGEQRTTYSQACAGSYGDMPTAEKSESQQDRRSTHQSREIIT